MRPTLTVVDAMRVLHAQRPAGRQHRRREGHAPGHRDVDQVAADAYGCTLIGEKPREPALPEDGPRARARHDVLGEPAARGGLSGPSARHAPRAICPAPMPWLGDASGRVEPLDRIRAGAIATRRPRARASAAARRSAGDRSRLGGDGRGRRRRRAVRKRAADAPRQPCGRSRRPQEAASRSEAARLGHPGAQGHPRVWSGCGASRRSAFFALFIYFLFQTAFRGTFARERRHAGAPAAARSRASCSPIRSSRR